MNVLLVRVGRDDERMAALRPPHSQLIANTVCLLGRDLSRIERLADLIAQHILTLFLFPARDSFVAGLCQKKLGGHRGRVTFIGGYVFSAFRLFRIFPIVQTVPDSLGYVLPVVGVALQ